MKVLTIDPSGNFSEGKGKTGYAVYNDGLFKFGTIKAENYIRRVDYWYDVAMLIITEKPELVVIEDYRLYNTSATGAKVQSFSLMETPRILGVLEYTAVRNNVPVIFQMANVTKPYDDSKLSLLGVLKKDKNRWWFGSTALNDHERSALRHLLRFLDKEKIKWTTPMN